MKTLKVSLVVGVGILVASLVLLWPQPVSSQGDPFLGTWVLNVAKSKYTPGPPPKSQTVVWEAAGQGVKITAKGMDANGKPTTTSYAPNYDGKDYPVTGNPDWDATSMKRVDARTVEVTRKKAGKIVQTGTIVISSDGKTRTNTTSGVDAQGRKIKTVAVYDKK